MNEILQGSIYFGLFLSLGTFWAGNILYNKFRIALLNPLIFSAVTIILILVIGKIDYKTYDTGARYITYFLTPATICLAVPMYKQLKILKENMGAIFIGIFAGCLASAIMVLGFRILFHLSPVLYHSLLPKSVTSAIAIGISEEIGGNPSITMGIVMVTGNLGGIMAKFICRHLKITNPIAVGLACGTSAHAVGTSKALEFGEVEGALGSLAIVVSGLISVILLPIFAIL